MVNDFSDHAQITKDLFAQVAIDFADGNFQAPSFWGEEDLSDEKLEDFKEANIFRKVYIIRGSLCFSYTSRHFKTS